MERDSGDPHVVVGVDGSVASILALRLAAKLAPALGAGIHAIACWEYPRLYEQDRLPDMTIFEKGARKRLDEAVQEAYGDELPHGFTSATAPGHPPTLLIEAGAKAQLLVVGRRGHGGLLGLHLGSVSNACVAHAACPVLVVHDDGGAQTHHRWRDRHQSMG